MCGDASLRIIRQQYQSLSAVARLMPADRTLRAAAAELDLLDTFCVHTQRKFA
jgi:hypothetical protein